MQLPTWESITPILTLIGFSGIVGAYFQSRLASKREQSKQRHDFKFTRYKCLIMLMHAALDFEKRNPSLTKHGNRNFQSLEDLLDDLDSELINLQLFSSSAVVKLVEQLELVPENRTGR